MLNVLQKVKRRLRLRLLDRIYPFFKPPTASSVIDAPSLLILPAADGWEGIGPHGFGDEMLMLGLLEGLKDTFTGRIDALCTNGDPDRKICFHGHQMRLRSLPEGWLSLSSYRDFADVVSEYSHFAVIGADVLDGAYGLHNTLQRLRFLAIASRMGRKTSITGCSFNGTGDGRIRKLFQIAEELGSAIHARDRQTLDRFGIFLNKVKLVADLAFMVDSELYPIAPSMKEIREKADAIRRAGGTVVGINLCGWHIQDKDAFFCDFCAHLIKMKASLGTLALVLLPHDSRTDRWSDVDTLKEFCKRLDGAIEILAGPEVIDSGIAAKQGVRCCDVLLTGRMHLAIAAHDQGVPSVSFGYQGKFEGFYALYGMGAEWLVNYGKPQEAVRTLHGAIESRNELRASIISRRAGIRAASRENTLWV